MVDIKYDKYSVITEIALFFLLGNAVLALDEVPLLHNLFSWLRVVAVGYAVLLFFNNRKIDVFTWLVALLYLFLGAITFKQHGAMFMWTSFTLNSLGISLLTYYSIKRSPNITIHIYAKLFAILIYFNFITMLIAPDGIFNGSYPLGSNYNQIGAKLICGMTIYIVAHRMKLRHYLPTLALSVTCALTPIILGSMTSAVGCMLMLLFFVIKNSKLRKIVIITFFIFYLVFQTFVVFMQGDLSENKQASYFIEEVLGKDLTFSDRARVWSEVIDYIIDSPTTGYGIQNVDWFESNFRVKSSHNIILQMMMYGGTVTLAILIFIIFFTVKRSIKERSAINDTLIFGLAVFFFMMMMESYTPVLVLFMINMLYYSTEFSKDSDLALNVSHENNQVLSHNTTLQ